MSRLAHSPPFSRWNPKVSSFFCHHRDCRTVTTEKMWASLPSWRKPSQCTGASDRQEEERARRSGKSSPANTRSKLKRLLSKSGRRLLVLGRFKGPMDSSKASAYSRLSVNIGTLKKSRRGAAFWLSFVRDHRLHDKG